MAVEILTPEDIIVAIEQNTEVASRLLGSRTNGKRFILSVYSHMKHLLEIERDLKYRTEEPFSNLREFCSKHRCASCPQSKECQDFLEGY